MQYLKAAKGNVFSLKGLIFGGLQTKVVLNHSSLIP